MWSNPSIERTAKSQLRWLSSAAHVERYSPGAALSAFEESWEQRLAATWQSFDSSPTG